MYELRHYQKEAVEKGLENFRQREKGLLILPCGAGKSLIIASIAKELEGNTIVFQPTKELLEQNVEKMRSYGYEDIGIFSASAGEKTIGKVTFATIGTIYNKPELWNNFKNVIIDECHLCNAKAGMYSEFIEKHCGSVLGLTATPFRMHAYRDFKTGERSVVAKMLTRTKPKIFTKISYITQIEELTKDGYWCPLDYIVNERYFPEKLKLNSTGMDYDDKSLKMYHEKINITKIVEQAIRKDKKHILVFNRFVEEAEKLSELLSKNGINSAIVSAQTHTKDREDIINKFKTGEIQVVCNVGILTVGFDFPELDCIIVARPLRSALLYYQILGRCVRPHQQKEKATIVDICGNTRRFGRIETFELVWNEKGLPRIKSEIGYITGYDFVNEIDVEEEPPQQETGIVIPFGKFRGTPVYLIPVGYLKWGAKNLDPVWKREFKRELSRRGLSTI